ncbi:hypothetical protein [Mesonia aquimarina]|uniref:hypothetical protein n=1 Tax=Mesonia aquimarina TaxID=1504967 RepID=UPI000EF59C5A|nr:hypothetical protein [Mesonia aquimarina]
MRNLIFILLSLIIFGCSKDDEDNKYNCENIESIGDINLNDENYTLETTGRGIDLREDGYEVSLFYSYYSESNSINISIKFPYKKTGKNVIEKIHFSYTQRSDNPEYYTIDLTPENFKSEVFGNTDYCFEGEFSTDIQIGGKNFVFDKAILSYKYEEPLNPVTIE